MKSISINFIEMDFMPLMNCSFISFIIDISKYQLCLSKQITPYSAPGQNKQGILPIAQPEAYPQAFRMVE